jgi:integrase
MMDVKRAWGDQGKQFRNLTGKITKEFKRAVRECGIDGKHHLHNTRHTFAIRNWLKSNNIYEVKEQLGHSTVSVTEGYAKHKRSKISADFPTLTKQIAEVPKSLELVEGVQINVYNEDERLS